MESNSLLLLAISASAGAVAILRLSWSRPKRSHRLNIAGWSLLAVAVAAGWNAAGAWGVSVEALAAMATAFILLACAAGASPRGVARASNRRAGMLPETGAPRHLWRRLATFVIVGVLALFASLGLALGIRMLALLSGAGEANANVVATFVTPLAWAVLAYALLMTSSRRRQLAMLTLGSLIALPAFLQGVPS